MDRTPKVSDEIAFGRFRVSRDRRELLADAEPVKLGGYAFDLLMVLIETPGAVLGKDDLLARVWPGRVVTENNLQAQISALRLAFGAEHGLIRTVAGRGYQFTGEIRAVSSDPDRAVAAERLAAGAGAVASPDNLPQPFSDLIGRDTEIAEIACLALAGRLVTLTGAGGIGKTRLALAVARGLLPHFPDGVWLAEFSPLADPRLVPAAVAAAAGLELAGELSAQRVAQALATRRMLVVLDTCEHVISAAAAMAEAALRIGSEVHVIATSREPLRTEGEQLYQVAPLAVPPDDAVDILAFGAARLFVERGRASGADLSLDQSQAAAITVVCRRLDGIPLAIEMAAARVAALGVEELAGRLGGRLGLLTGGRRTALKRHQTLRATLDWSHELLRSPERMVLRRLGVFAGTFSLEAASSVAASAEIASPDVVDGLSSLIEKSLIVAELDRASPRYRLLDTTRAYALEKLAESGERGRLARRHAEYQRSVFDRARLEWVSLPTPVWLATYGNHLDDLRAALDWAFSPLGDVSLGVTLTVDAVPLWLQLSLTSECGHRAEQALLRLGETPDPDRRYEMELRAALATSVYYTKGVVPEIAATLTTTLEIAEQLNDDEFQLQALYGLWSYHISAGRYATSLALGRRFSAVAALHAAPQAVQLVGDRLVAVPLHFLGDLNGARMLLDRLLNRPVRTFHGSHIVRYQYDQRIVSQVTLVRVLWLQGYPDQAMQLAQGIVDEARASAHQVSLGFTLAQAGFQVALFAGDLAKAEQYVEQLLEHSATYEVGLWTAYGIGARGMLATQRGHPLAGAQLLSEGLAELSKDRFHLFHTMLLGGHAEALGAAGFAKEGLAAIEEALTRAQANEERWYIPELLRIQSELIRQDGSPAAAAEAERLLVIALAEARGQGALSWELRAAMSFARLRRDQGRSAEGTALLRSVYERFTEGFDSADLKAARTLLHERP